MRNFITLLTAAAVLLIGVPALACIHAMAKTAEKVEVPVEATDLEAIVAWHDGVQDLVVALGYRSNAKKATPMAYVVPVPNRPSHYAVTDFRVLADMRDYVGLTREVEAPIMKSASRSRGAKKPKPEPLALEKFQPITVGPYEIQPLKASGAAGLTALQQWMKKNGFVELPAEDAKYYVQRDWTFLAIKVTPDDESQQVGTIPPLHLRFDSNRPVLPLKLLRPQKPIKAIAYFLAEEQFTDETARAVSRHGFEVVRGDRWTNVSGSAVSALRAQRDVIDPADAPPSVRTLIRGFGWDDIEKPKLTVLFSDSFGTDSADPASWKEDLSIPPVADAQKLWGGQRMPTVDDDGARKPAGAEDTDGAENENDKPYYLEEDVPPGVEDGARASSEEPPGDHAHPKHYDFEPGTTGDDEPVDASPSFLTSCSQVGGSSPSLIILFGILFGVLRRRRA